MRPQSVRSDQTLACHRPPQNAQVSPARPSWPRRGPEDGFTLIEVMVVVLIIGLLLAVAVPSLLGARNRAHDAAARSSLDSAVKAATIVSDLGVDSATADAASLSLAEPSLTFLPGTQASTGPNEVSVEASTSNRWVATVKSSSGTCFAVEFTPSGTSQYLSQSCSAALAHDITTPVTPVNVAPMSVVSHTCCYSGDAHPASNLIDGSLSNFNHAAWVGGASAGFELASTVTITEIRLWNRADCCSNRMKNMSIFVSDQPIATSLASAQASGAASFSLAGEVGRPSTIAVNLEGRYVRIFNGGTSLHLAEVEIMAVGP